MFAYLGLQLQENSSFLITITVSLNFVRFIKGNQIIFNDTANSLGIWRKLHYLSRKCDYRETACPRNYLLFFKILFLAPNFLPIMRSYKFTHINSYQTLGAINKIVF